MSFDVYNSGKDDLDNPASRSADITPHATNPLPFTSRSIYFGVGGDIVVRLVGDSTDRTFVGVPQGSLLPIRATHVRSGPTSLVALA